MIRAMIFDLDGTLVQTEKLKALSYARAAVTLRPDLKEADVIEAFREVVGLPRHAVAQSLMKRFDLEPATRKQMASLAAHTPWQAFVQMRLYIYDDLLMDPRVLLRNQWPHNIDLVKRARRSCRKVGLATMSYYAHVQRVLDLLGLNATFDFIASRDDVENGKPDPEIYQLVAAQLQMRPSECLVVEDSPAGVKAALDAGMACIAVSTPFTKSSLRSGGLIDRRWIVDDPGLLLDTVDRMIAAHGKETRRMAL